MKAVELHTELSAGKCNSSSRLKGRGRRKVNW